MDAVVRGELLELVARYALAVDTLDASALATLFAPDARILVPAVLGGTGLEQAVGNPVRLLEPLRQFDRTRHTIGQQTVQLDGLGATTTTYAEAHHLYDREGQWRDFAVYLRYLDDVVRADGGWVFSRRVLCVDWTRRVTVDRPEPRA